MEMRLLVARLRKLCRRLPALSVELAVLPSPKTQPAELDAKTIETAPEILPVFLGAPEANCPMCGLPKRPGYICRACGFCGIIVVIEAGHHGFPISPNVVSRLVSEGMPAGANEAEDSSQRSAQRGVVR